MANTKLKRCVDVDTPAITVKGDVGERARRLPARGLVLHPSEKLFRLSSSTCTAMVAFFGGASLKLLACQKLVVLNPEHGGNPHLYGDVVLSLPGPSPRTVEAVVVRHVVKYTLTLPGRKREQGVLQTAQVDIPLPAVLKAGENVFSWALPIPEKTLPRERAATGSVTHILQAVAVGAGFGGSDLLDEVEVYMVHGNDDEYSTHLHLEGVNELGPYAVDLDSPHLTVGGLLRFHLRLAAPPADSALHIRSIALHIEQTSSARPPSTPDAQPESLSRRVPVFRLGHTTPRQPPSRDSHRWPRHAELLSTEAARPHDEALLAVVPPGADVRFDYVARLPGHCALRPTSAAASPAFIRIAHRAVVQIRLASAQGERLVTFSHPLRISYCCCRLDAVLLPVYRSDASPSAGEGCTCTMSTDRLWEMLAPSPTALARSECLPQKLQ